MSITNTHVVVRPILPVVAMEPAIAFYRRLGFEVTSWDKDYAWVGWDGHELLHLRQVPGLDGSANASSCYLHVDDADRWHATWSLSGVEIGPPEDEAWGMREFAVTDPSGNLIRVGSPSTGAEPGRPLPPL